QPRHPAPQDEPPGRGALFALISLVNCRILATDSAGGVFQPMDGMVGEAFAPFTESAGNPGREGRKP
ncbi:MAG TPA: hypothetical protein VF459_10960, partial [Caulobacteraceae bacterium]